MNDLPDSLPQIKNCDVHDARNKMMLLNKYGIFDNYDDYEDDIISNSISIYFMIPPSSTVPMVWFPYTKYIHSRLMFQDFLNDLKIDDKRYIITWFHILKLNYVIEKGLEIKFKYDDSNEYVIEHVLGDIQLRYAIVRFDDIC